MLLIKVHIHTKPTGTRTTNATAKSFRLATGPLRPYRLGCWAWHVLDTTGTPHQQQEHLGMMLISMVGMRCCYILSIFLIGPKQSNEVQFSRAEISRRQEQVHCCCVHMRTLCTHIKCTPTNVHKQIVHAPTSTPIMYIIVLTNVMQLMNTNSWVHIMVHTNVHTEVQT